MNKLKGLNLITNRLNKLIINNDIKRYEIATTPLTFKERQYTNVLFKIVIWDMENQKEVEYFDSLDIQIKTTKKGILKAMNYILSERLGDFE